MNRISISISISIIFFVSIFTSANLQAEEDPLRESVSKLKQKGESSSKTMDEVSHRYYQRYEAEIYNEQIKSALSESFINKLEWNDWILEHNKEVYRQHAAESRYIFLMVFALTIFSMFMVAWQFWIYSRKIRINSATETPMEAGTVLTSGVFSISKDGVKIDTPFIGAMILVITFFFLNSYLTNVYPIHKNDQEVQEAKES